MFVGMLLVVFDQCNLSFVVVMVNVLIVLGVMQWLVIGIGVIICIYVSCVGDFGCVQMEVVQYQCLWFGQVVVVCDFGQVLEICLDELICLICYWLVCFICFGEMVDGYCQVFIVDDGGECCLLVWLVVGVDGICSGVCDVLGIGVDDYDFEQILFVVWVCVVCVLDGMVYECFIDIGFMVLLLCGDCYYGVVYGVVCVQVEVVLVLDDVVWLQCLQDVIGWWVGWLLESGLCSVYLLIQVLVQLLVGEWVVLLGNVVQIIYLFGVQGFNLGLCDVLILVELVGVVGDLGSDVFLVVYVVCCVEDCVQIIVFFGGLVWLISNLVLLMWLLCSFGLLVVQVMLMQLMLVGGVMGFCGEVLVLCWEGVV